MSSLTKMDYLKAELNSLKSELGKGSFLISEHCDSIKNEIDIHTENLIAKLNKYRDELFTTIDSYEIETNLNAKNSEEYKEMSKLLLKLEDSIVCNDLSQNLINTFLEKLKIYKENLDVIRFDNKLIRFEPNESETESLMGKLYHNHLVSNMPIDKVTPLENTAYFKFVRKDFFPKDLYENDINSTVEFRQFKNGNYFYMERFQNYEERIVILSPDFKCLKSKTLKNFFPRISLSRKFDIFINSDDMRVLVSCYTNFIDITLCIFDASLNILNKFYLNPVDIHEISCNDSYIFCLGKENSLSIYDWDFNLIKLIVIQESTVLLDSTKILGLFVDKENRILIQYKTNENKLRFLLSFFNTNSLVCPIVRSVETEFDLSGKPFFDKGQLFILQAKQKRMIQLNLLNGKIQSEKKINFDGDFFCIKWVNFHKKIFLIEESHLSSYFYKFE